jgi:RES domain-containing protein
MTQTSTQTFNGTQVRFRMRNRRTGQMTGYNYVTAVRWAEGEGRNFKGASHSPDATKAARFSRATALAVAEAFWHLQVEIVNLKGEIQTDLMDELQRTREVKLAAHREAQARAAAATRELNEVLSQAWALINR